MQTWLSERPMTNEELQLNYLEQAYKQAGGKEAYETLWSERRAAQAALPSVPDLEELLAQLWSANRGDDWAGLSEAERWARQKLMRTSLARSRS